MNIIKNKILLIMIIIFLSLTCIFSEDSEEKKDNTTIGELTGTIDIKFGKFWYINMNYKDKIIKGEFNKRVPMNLPKNKYIVEIRIDDRMYKGAIFHKIPLFGKGSYEVDILCYKTKLEGEITTFYKKVFKQHKIECIFGDSFLEGDIIYGRKNDEVKISVNNEEFKINGYTVMKDRKNRIIDFLINDKKIFGTVKLDRTVDEYILNTQDLTDDELFFFLFFEAFLRIENKEVEDSKNR